VANGNEAMKCKDIVQQALEKDLRKPQKHLEQLMSAIIWQEIRRKKGKSVFQQEEKGKFIVSRCYQKKIKKLS